MHVDHESNELAGQPYFSVVIPVHNRAPRIARTLCSVWSQSMADFEVIIVDDGSTDELDHVLSNEDDSRLTVVRQPNAGAAAARNAGVRRARGSYVAYLDSDDLWFPDYLESVQRLIEQDDADLVYGSIVVDRGVGKFFVRPSRKIEASESFYDYRFLAGEMMQTSTLVVSDRLARQVEWDETISYGDVDQYIASVFDTGARPSFLVAPLVVYDDTTCTDKLSQPWSRSAESVAPGFKTWADAHRPEMSDLAWLSFCARNATHSDQPLRETIGFLLRARGARALSTSVALRELVRARSPLLYRRIINWYVRARGDSLENVLSSSVEMSSR